MKMTVLLIEDNAHNRYLTTFLLEKDGFDVICADNGPAGLELARTHRPDVILLDIQLPRMNGYEVAQRVRDIDFLATTPVVAVTSHAMGGDRERALEAGCTGYIEKPIDPETFVSSIRTYVAS